MADEISFSVSLAIAKGANLAGVCVATRNMSGERMIAATQPITTSAVAVNRNGANPIELAFIKNLSATESVEIGINNTVTQRITTLKPGGAILLDQPPTLYAKTVANAASIWIALCEGAAE